MGAIGQGRHRPGGNGDTVVVHAAAGGVGLLLTQMVTMRGGIVVATTSTTAKAVLARQAGAAHLAGLAAGLVLTRARRRPAAIVPAGLGAWLGAAGFGMPLRAVSGQGTAVPFIVVALAFLGLFMLGWRLIASASVRGARTRPG